MCGVNAGGLLCGTSIESIESIKSIESIESVESSDSIESIQYRPKRNLSTGLGHVLNINLHHKSAPELFRRPSYDVFGVGKSPFRILKCQHLIKIYVINTHIIFDTNVLVKLRGKAI